MRLVIIESPWSGNVARNRRYLQRCIRDCLARGESPYASHMMLTEALDDSKPDERDLGIRAGFAWREATDATVVYEDHGRSVGMMLGINDALWLARRQRDSGAITWHAIEYRSIGPEPDREPMEEHG